MASTGASNTDGGSAAGSTYAIARVITAAPSCPTVTFDTGSPVTMGTRAAPATNPLRPTISSAAMSKPSAFPVLTCETNVPPGATSAVVNAALPGASGSTTTLPLPKADAETIVVLGDTGCRTQYGAGGTSQWQDCYDPAQYGFGTIASAAGAANLHLLTSSSTSATTSTATTSARPTRPGCAGAPWGWPRLGRVAGRLLFQAGRAAPRRQLRGSSPEATTSRARAPARAGSAASSTRTGYDSVAGKDCNAQGATLGADAGGGFVGDNLGGYNTPYAVQVRGDTQVIVFDTSNITKSAITPTGANGNEYSAYATEVQQVAGLTKSNTFNIWTNHHPLFGLAAGPPVASSAPALLSVMQNLYPDTIFPPGINMALHGHVHLFEALDYTATASDAGVPNNYPATFVSGNAGDILDTDLPTPLPDGSTPLSTAAVPPQIANLAHSPNFGFLVMQHVASDAGGNGGWQLTEYKTDGTTVRTTCTATMNGHTNCSVWGTIP